jgi:hypothetical protein
VRFGLLLQLTHPAAIAVSTDRARSPLEDGPRLVDADSLRLPEGSIVALSKSAADRRTMIFHLRKHFRTLLVWTWWPKRGLPEGSTPRRKYPKCGSLAGHVPRGPSTMTHDLRRPS